eukprot:XP_028339745.1 uncharacterized protein LOC114484854 isoform X1 [Physeter catodon]
MVPKDTPLQLKQDEGILRALRKQDPEQPRRRVPGPRRGLHPEDSWGGSRAISAPLRRPAQPSKCPEPAPSSWGARVTEEQRDPVLSECGSPHSSLGEVNGPEAAVTVLDHPTPVGRGLTLGPRCPRGPSPSRPSPSPASKPRCRERPRGNTDACPIRSRGSPSPGNTAAMKKRNDCI